MKKLLFIFVLLLLCLIPAFLGIFHPGFFQTDDGSWMIIRLSAFYEALRYGQFPVRFLPRLYNGYGYPVADFLYPLFLYLGSFIHIFRINFTWTIKILFALSLFASSVGTYLWLKKHFTTISAFVGSLVFTLFPYHLWDITKRGSLGEVLALGIVPFIFWQIDDNNVFFTALFIGLLILSHNTLALLFLPIIIVYMLLQRKFLFTGIALVFGLGLTTFFWFPALYDEKYVVFGKTVVANFSQYFLTNDLYSLIGIVSFFVLLFSMYGVIKKSSYFFIFFLCAALISLTLTTKVTTPIWQILHLGKYVQFPFRFLSITALCIGFLAAQIINNTKKSQQIFIGGIILILLFVSSYQFFFAKTYQQYPDTFYSTNEDTTTVQNEYLPLWVEKLPTTSTPKITAPKTTQISDVSLKGSTLSFVANSASSSQLLISFVYYPGWYAFVDTNRAKIMYNNPYGFMQITVPQGMHMVRLFFGETPIRQIADIISLVFLIIFLGLCIFIRKKIWKFL